METFRVKAFYSEHFRNLLGVFVLVNVATSIWHPLHGWDGVILFLVYSVGSLVYGMFDSKKPRPLKIEESLIQIGKTTVNPAHVDRVVIAENKNQAVISFTRNSNEKRPYFSSIRIRPITEADAFYQQLREWSRMNRVPVQGKM